MEEGLFREVEEGGHVLHRGEPVEFLHDDGGWGGEGKGERAKMRKEEGKRGGENLHKYSIEVKKNKQKKQKKQKNKKKQKKQKTKEIERERERET